MTRLLNPNNTAYLTVFFHSLPHNLFAIASKHIPHSVFRRFSNLSKPGAMEETKDGQTSSHTQMDYNTVLENEDFPKPLSQPPPELSRQVEYDRAMRAEAAVKAGPALSRNEFIYEDEWMIAVNKPSGVYCEHVLSSIPELLASSPSSAGAANDVNPLELHLANRLDRDTSGVMVITKLHKIAGQLVKAFTDRKVRKTYLALCIGPAPKWNNIYIESGHGRSKFGAWRVYSRTDVGRILPGGTVVREMATHLKVLAVNANHRMHRDSVDEAQNSSQGIAFDLKEDRFATVGDNGSTDSIEKVVVTEQNSKAPGQDRDIVSSPNIRKNDEVLIRASPLSGRTHQIRLHCQYMGLPIRGDVKYEGPHIWKGITYANHALHAESLCFEHPVTVSDVCGKEQVVWINEFLMDGKRTVDGKLQRLYGKLQR